MMPHFDPAWLYAQIIERTTDAVVCADRQGIVRFWNVAAEALFGYASAEIVGQNLELIIPPKLRARHTRGYERVMAGGASGYAGRLLAVPARRKDGRRISVEFSLVLLQDAAGGVCGAAAIIRDVTVRWQREKELKERLDRLTPQGTESSNFRK